MASKGIYLVEGKDNAVLIDARTRITDLDKILATITKKPIVMVATHVYPDHVGLINYFPEIYLNPADAVNIGSIENLDFSPPKFSIDSQ